MKLLNKILSWQVLAVAWIIMLFISEYTNDLNGIIMAGFMSVFSAIMSTKE